MIMHTSNAPRGVAERAAIPRLAPDRLLATPADAFAWIVHHLTFIVEDHGASCVSFVSRPVRADPRGWECPGPQARFLILRAPSFCRITAAPVWCGRRGSVTRWVSSRRLEFQ